MLMKVRIEVEEPTADACVAALESYEDDLMLAEIERYELGDPEVSDEDLLGRDLQEEVIEYDPSIPGYRGRRIALYRRLDGRMRNWNDVELQSQA